MSATATENQVILSQRDFLILNDYVLNLHGMQVNERENYAKLSIELGKALKVSEEDFPADVVGINSKVTITDLATKRDKKITIVMPPKADIKEKKISVLAPIGTALIGFRKGQEVSWDVPAGKKTFLIAEVDNSERNEK